MSDNRDERFDGAAQHTPTDQPSAGQPMPADAQPTLPLGQTSDTQPTVPLGTAAAANGAAFPNPYTQQPAAPHTQPAAPHAQQAPHQQAPSGAAFGATPGSHAFPSQYGAAAGARYGTPAQSQPHPQSQAPAATAAPARQKRGAGMLVGAWVLAALIGGSAGLGGAWAGNNLFGKDTAGASSSPRTVTINNPDSVNAVTAVAAKVTPSVVTISATAGQTGGSGSGVVLSADGYVLTNTHVVTLDGASGTATLRVTASDGKIYNATVVGTDPTYDLAVIKLDGASGLTPMEFADSSKLNVGDQAIAIGAPLGLENTVTQGIVSALNRSIQIQSSAVPENQSDQSTPDQQQNGQSPFQFDLPGQQQQSSSAGSISIAVIQTDAAINPGNSGGALVDSEGKLIGINVAIASAGQSTSGSSQSGNIGVGFSIPSNVAERVSQEIIKDGKATHGLLGATVASADQLKDATVDGAVIQEVTAGGAAANAGLKAGDVVTEFDGKPITSSIDLTAQVRALAAGATAKVTYVRNGQTEQADVTLGSLG